MGQRTFIVSETPEAANLIKLSGNFLIAAVMESLGEAMALVGKAGIDKRQYLIGPAIATVLTRELFYRAFNNRRELKLCGADASAVRQR